MGGVWGGCLCLLSTALERDQHSAHCQLDSDARHGRHEHDGPSIALGPSHIPSPAATKLAPAAASGTNLLSPMSYLQVRARTYAGECDVPVPPPKVPHLLRVFVRRSNQVAADPRDTPLQGQQGRAGTEGAAATAHPTHTHTHTANRVASRTLGVSVECCVPGHPSAARTHTVCPRRTAHPHFSCGRVCSMTDAYGWERPGAVPVRAR
jgi:hypothetical protein